MMIIARKGSLIAAQPRDNARPASQYVHDSHVIKKKHRNQRNRGRARSYQRRPKRILCDCGQPAITVLVVKVGCDPQYTVHLPLCLACLALEQSFDQTS